MKSFFIWILVLGGSFTGLQTNAANGRYENYNISRNDLFKGRALEAVYKVHYVNATSKSKRYFEVIKTDEKLKAYFLADYLLVEKTTKLVLYYPLGWETDAIKVSDVKANCKAIINGEVHPVNIEK